MLVGLSTSDSVEQKICKINLDKKGKAYVTNSTPARICPESAACVINNVIYCVGVGLASNELWKWSPAKDDWTRLADLPWCRRRHCVTGLCEKIYVLGGWADADKRALHNVLCYDIKS